MCGIVGWSRKGNQEEKVQTLLRGTERGRDGYGFLADGKEYRGLGLISDLHLKEVSSSTNVVGNYRATPTTEAESDLENLQPYDGIVHNGMIANDKDFAEVSIDSMVLPKVLRPKTFEATPRNLEKLKGSYAIAFFSQKDLILACNYKPIYYRRSDDGIMFGSTPDMLPESIPLNPYSVMRYSGNGKIDRIELPRNQKNRVIVASSSGLDSTAVAYWAKQKGMEVTLGHFIYGCLAEKREVSRIEQIAEHGGFRLEFIEMPKVMKGTITSGTYHKDQIAGTEYAMDWVSARNLLMLSILTAWSESNNYGYIAFGGNLEESGAYPDNEQEFGRRFNALLPYCTQNGVKIELLQPVANLMKHEIVKLGNELNVPWELTWSCYSDRKTHCGNCAPCFMRKTAFERNGLIDPVFA